MHKQLVAVHIQRVRLGRPRVGAADPEDLHVLRVIRGNEVTWQRLSPVLLRNGGGGARERHT